MPNITVQTTQSPITVTTNRISVTASTTGIQGPPGPQGPPGTSNSSGSSSLAEMNDVIVLNPQNDQFLKYINGAWTNVNTLTIDGGNW